MSTHDQATFKTNGRWTKLEHQKFLEGLELYGKNWKKIQQLVQTRDGAQIRSHAQKFFLKVKKTFDETKFSGEQSEEPKQIKRKETLVDEPTVECSFFMSEIVKKGELSKEINFWEMFVDIGKPKLEGESESSLRKGSFVMHDSTQLRVETPINNIEADFGFK